MRRILVLLAVLAASIDVWGFSSPPDTIVRAGSRRDTITRVRIVDGFDPDTSRMAFPDGDTSARIKTSAILRDWLNSRGAVKPQGRDSAAVVDGAAPEETAAANEPERQEVTDIAPLQRHLLFRGIPVDGSVDDFSRQLQKLGYSQPRREGGAVFLTGDFSGIPNSRVEVYPVDGIVYLVRVSFPAQPYWSAARNRYQSLKMSFRQKYGREFDSTERLSRRFPEGGGNEVWGFQDESSVWESSFAAPMGTIVVKVLFDTQTEGFRVIADYLDKVNYRIKKDLDLDDL